MTKEKTKDSPGWGMATKLWLVGGMILFYALCFVGSAMRSNWIANSQAEEFDNTVKQYRALGMDEASSAAMAQRTINFKKQAASE